MEPWARAAGVRKPPGEETALGERAAVPRSLWGFSRRATTCDRYPARTGGQLKRHGPNLANGKIHVLPTRDFNDLSVPEMSTRQLLRDEFHNKLGNSIERRDCRGLRKSRLAEPKLFRFPCQDNCRRALAMFGISGSEILSL